MALAGVRHGSGRNLSPIETGFSFYWQYFSLMDFSHNHDRHLAYPLWTPGRAVTDFSKTPKDVFSSSSRTKTTVPKIVSVKCMQKLI